MAVDTSTRTPADRRPPGTPGGRRRRGRRELAPYILATPTLVVLVGLLAYPLGKMIVLSFQKMTLRELFSGETPPFSGLDNYVEALSEPLFWTVVIRTIIVAAICVVLSVGLGMLIALLMRRVASWVRLVMIAVMMLVWAMPQLVATQVFAWMVDSDWGVVNWLVDQVPGVDFGNHSWFVNPKEGWAVIIALVVWGAIPFLAISLYAGMTQVPRELVEAAVVDGASPWAVFRNVIIPVIRPLLVIVTTLSVIWDMGLFTQVYVMRGAKPEQDFYTLSIYAYVEAFGKSNYSLGSAISIITVALMIGVLAFYARQMFRLGEAD
jgi:N,N'-diacetylchitobiose transport system permease protein